jgi:DNA-binding NarL/FixJ family response regulator
MKEVRVLLVDDHDLLRDTLAERLRREDGLTIAGVAGDAQAGLELALVCRPDVAMMDIDMPGRPAFEAARDLVRALPDTRLLFLSAFAHDRYIDQALSVGALGYLTKSESVERVIDAIRRVSEGRAYFSREVAERIVVEGDGARLERDSKGSRASTLTRRENEVLCYLARGRSKKEIAASMHLSVKTVEKHTDNLMRKLEIHDRVELARFAIREGLTEP